MIYRACIVVALLLVSDGRAIADLIPDAGAGPGVSIAVPSGTPVTVTIAYFPPFAAPIPFDGVGLDLNWTPTGSAMATPSGPFPGILLAGIATGLAPVDDLLAPAGPGSVTPGAPLANPALPPAAGAFSIGGGAHFDFLGGATSTGISYGLPSGSVPMDLVGADFIVTGSPGDTITFVPSGILPLPIGTPVLPGAFVPVPGGAQYYSNSAVGAGLGFTSGLDPLLGTVVVTIIPEPGMLWLIGFGLVGLLRLSRFTRAL